MRLFNRPHGPQDYIRQHNRLDDHMLFTLSAGSLSPRIQKLTKPCMIMMTLEHMLLKLKMRLQGMGHSVQPHYQPMRPGF